MPLRDIINRISSSLTPPSIPRLSAHEPKSAQESADILAERNKRLAAPVQTPSERERMSQRVSQSVSPTGGVTGAKIRRDQARRNLQKQRAVNTGLRALSGFARLRDEVLGRKTSR